VVYREVSLAARSTRANPRSRTEPRRHWRGSLAVTRRSSHASLAHDVHKFLELRLVLLARPLQQQRLGLRSLPGRGNRTGVTGWSPRAAALASGSHTCSLDKERLPQSVRGLDGIHLATKLSLHAFRLGQQPLGLCVTLCTQQVLDLARPRCAGQLTCGTEGIGRCK